MHVWAKKKNATLIILLTQFIGYNIIIIYKTLIHVVVLFTCSLNERRKGNFWFSSFFHYQNWSFCFSWSGKKLSSSLEKKKGEGGGSTLGSKGKAKLERLRSSNVSTRKSSDHLSHSLAHRLTKDLLRADWKLRCFQNKVNLSVSSHPTSTLYDKGECCAIIILSAIWYRISGPWAANSWEIKGFFKITFANPPGIF